MATIPPGATVAVTGASGFIGSHVVEACLQAGYVVRACVRDPSNEAKVAHLEALAAKHGGAVELARGDLLEAGSFDAFDGAAAVVHVAAVVEILKVSDPGGGATYDEADFNGWSTVETDPYGFAKSSAEALVREACETMALPLATLNPGVTLGPCFTKQHTKASTVLLRELLYGNKMLNYNCCFVDVRDVGAAHARRDAASMIRINRCLSMPATGRHLLVNDAGVMNTLDLGAVARAACPQWKTVAAPMYAPALIAALRVVYDAPLVGPSLAGLAGITEFKLRVFEEKIPFSNAKRASCSPSCPRHGPRARRPWSRGWVKAKAA
ncbi:dihydrokaempferol 4-reductase [Aureococcus anophagefferens]|nr:dihydrokaempferol 4-reductase [Aureococcus anophagefferens]